MDISYKASGAITALWSRSPTPPSRCSVLDGANRPSHEGADPLYDRAIELCRRAGFSDILLRGDTDFSLTLHSTAGTTTGVRFVFGYDANANLIQAAEGQPEDLYHELVRQARTPDRDAAPDPARKRQRRDRSPARLQDDTTEEGTGRRVLATSRALARRTTAWSSCARTVDERGDNVLFDEYRYFFYITNDRKLTADRCRRSPRALQPGEPHRAAQERRPRAARPGQHPHANWAYMVMASLAWTLKAWCALLLPVSPRWEKQHEQQRADCSPWSSAPSGPL